MKGREAWSRLPSPAGAATYVIPGSHNSTRPIAGQQTAHGPIHANRAFLKAKVARRGPGLIAGPGTLAEIIPPPPVLQGPFVMPDPVKALPPPVSTGQILAEYVQRQQTRLLSPSGATPLAPVG